MTKIKEDPIAALIIVCLMMVSLWIALMPLVPTVATTTMRRFHLRSANYARWAVQFPIPAMYNFANQFRVGELRRAVPGDGPADVFESQLADEGVTADMSSWRYLNHFPTRTITFADGRFRHLRWGKPHRFEFQSRYRQHVVRSAYEVVYLGDGEFRMTRSPLDAPSEIDSLSETDVLSKLEPDHE